MTQFDNREHLKPGMVVETKNGNKYLLVIDCSVIKLFNLKTYQYSGLNLNFHYDINLIYTNNCPLIGAPTDYNIVKVYADHNCKMVSWKRDKRPNLTQHEEHILNTLPLEYNNWWIARDPDGDLCLYSEKPFVYSSQICEIIDHWFCDGDIWDMKPYKNSFRFVTWKGKEHYKVGYLLGECDSNE